MSDSDMAFYEETERTTPVSTPGPELVTLQDVEKALANTVGKRGVPAEETERIAAYLMNFFGFGDYVIDNMLNSDDRDVFYMLEEEEILTTAREEITLYKGKVWRVHYWVLKKRSILAHARDDEDSKKGDPEASVYAELDSDVWKR